MKIKNSNNNDEKNDSIDFADKFDSEERKKLNDQILAKKQRSRKINAKINAIVLAVILAGVYYYTLGASFMQNDLQLKTTKSLFNNPDIPNIAMGQFGYTMYAFVDAKSVVLPVKGTEEVDSFAEGYEKPEQVSSDFTRYIDFTFDLTINRFLFFRK